MRTMNKKGIMLPQAKRFSQYNLFKGGSKASAFLGPGTYNDHESFLKLSKMPCPSLMVCLTLPICIFSAKQKVSHLGKKAALPISWWDRALNTNQVRMRAGTSSMNWRPLATPI